MTTTQVEAQNIQVGDVLVFLNSSFRVLRIHDYPQFANVCPGRTARIAVCDRGFGVTLVDGQRIEVEQ